MADWSTRIPAAIEKAEKQLRWCTSGLSYTAGEVALAKALWLEMRCHHNGKTPDPALIAYTEKLEALSALGGAEEIESL